MRALLLMLAIGSACGDNDPARGYVPLSPEQLFACRAPSATARLDVGTCVDHQDAAICRWADPAITTAEHVVACIGPDGVVCVEDCPPNHYGDTP